MTHLDRTLRNKLEHTVMEAREVAETAARAAVEQLGVGEAKPDAHLNAEERELRRRLRIHGRQLGDIKHAKQDTQEIYRLVEEIAYEHWHRMLFARFLAENNLLMYPDPTAPVAVSLQECEDLAAEEGAKNGWELAARYAARMLPQIFQPESPVFQLILPPEHQQRLERLVADLPLAVFTASDSLGWVYQFWQAKRKDTVNASEVKIGARELPAVTQLFTEPYMVAFLLDNTLGAWWAGKVARAARSGFDDCQTEEDCRRLCALPGVPLEYLRFVKAARASDGSKGVPPLSLSASPDRDGLATVFSPADFDTLQTHEGENLPHWHCDRAIYHVSFRLADSVPAAKRNEWLTERAAIEDRARQQNRPLSSEEEKRIQFLYSERIEEFLDSGHGECLLARPEIGGMVAEAMRHFDGERYRLHAWCVMPNHVHAIVEPLPGHDLSTIIHSWKSFTAHRTNTMLGRKGSLWQEDAYNHIIRTEKEYHFQVRYTVENPAKAGLKGWRWVAIASRSGNSENPDPDRDGLATTWQPAAGTFDGWPEDLAELTVLDPCCGSGHFLVAAFLMLVPMRMEREGLSAREAVDRVLAENLHGLEIDQRCVELAAFALALTAWNYPQTGGYRPLPELNVACAGLSISASKEQWMAILEGQYLKLNLRFYFGLLYDLFSKAPTLGSLINPHRFLGSGLLDERGMQALLQVLHVAAETEAPATEQHELGVVAAGLAKAAELLAERYTLVATNVPYLGRGKQDDVLKDHLETQYPLGKADLATAFVLRCLEFCAKGGATALVTPQNWLFLTTYKKLRETLLRNRTWDMVARLGPGAFETISGHVVNVALPLLSAATPEDDQSMAGIDVSAASRPEDKAALLRGDKPAEIVVLQQKEQLKNPDTRVLLTNHTCENTLADFATSQQGITTGDLKRFGVLFWEVSTVDAVRYRFWQSTSSTTGLYLGRDLLLKWIVDECHLENVAGATLRGSGTWGKDGVLVGLMSNLPVTLSTGEISDDNSTRIIPRKEGDLAAIWCFCSSSAYNESVRGIDQALKVMPNTAIQVPFDLSHWQKVAAEKYPNGLPEPESDDPTQWLFHGRPEAARNGSKGVPPLSSSEGPDRDGLATLQVAVARLLGYRWPAENDEKMRLSERARELVRRCDELLPLADRDGIVCLPPVRGEASAADRLLNLLAAAYGKDWSPGVLNRLLKEAGFEGKTLDTWLRDGFFAQHCELFQQRPFVWHIWDGLRDGFAALVNYHRLDRKNLETLIYTYLGDWIKRQKDDIASRVDGAQERLAAAETLKKRLELILAGEAPYDIFVRWKPIHQQPVGWEPDLNDGVRLNIRPFLTVPDIKKKGAGVLREKPRIDWMKDRGKEPLRPLREYPWFWGWDETTDFTGGAEFTGERFNDCHYTLDFKRRARREASTEGERS